MTAAQVLNTIGIRPNNAPANCDTGTIPNFGSNIKQIMTL
jgi:hypothetical protein